jgi:hypothetical protein
MTLELAVSLTEGEIALAIAGLDPELTHLFDTQGVPLKVQAIISHLGYSECETFSKVDDTPAGFESS